MNEWTYSNAYYLKKNKKKIKKKTHTHTQYNSNTHNILKLHIHATVSLRYAHIKYKSKFLNSFIYFFYSDT